MEMITLKASARDNVKPSALRRSGQVPAVIYGDKVQSVTIQCEAISLHKAFAKAGESTLVEIDLGGKKIPALFKAVDFHPITSREIHVDFYAVDMKKAIDTLVPVHFEGEAPAVKEHGGVFVITHESVKVRCLPADLPHSLTVSIAGLAEFRQSVAVKDIQALKGVTIMDAQDMKLATIQEPRKEEVIVAPVAAITTEGAATAEGAAPAEGEAAKDGAPAAATGSPAKDGKKEGGKDKK